MLDDDTMLRLSAHILDRDLLDFNEPIRCEYRAGKGSEKAYFRPPSSTGTLMMEESQEELGRLWEHAD